MGSTELKVVEKGEKIEKKLYTPFGYIIDRYQSGTYQSGLVPHSFNVKGGVGYVTNMNNKV